MQDYFNREENIQKTRALTGYVPYKSAVNDTYTSLGFKCGLEVHQQLLTEKKLFCRCPAGIYFEPGYFEAELIRHMRPTLSELGEYDGTALMEFKTRKKIIYRIRKETTCTYEIDDTPPFSVNLSALDIAVEIACLLRTNIVGELHITRKQYLDGSIPTGFQRTAIVGIEGKIPLKNKDVRIIQLSLEEDSCREVSDFRHERIYTTDRLGMPLIETVTYPDMLNPLEVVEAGQYIRFLTRSTGKVRTGIGATRQDVNVSVSGGTRVELKGISKISYFPWLVHNEAFRQKALLEIQKILIKRFGNKKNWHIFSAAIDPDRLDLPHSHTKAYGREILSARAVRLPGFEGILSFFTSPGKDFSDELSGRLKVIAGLEKPNLIHSEDDQFSQNKKTLNEISRALHCERGDSVLLFWGPEEDMKTALEAVEERCLLLFDGVPGETRKGLPDGTTIFERVLPGPDRMYPDTDSAPIPLENKYVENIEANLPVPVKERFDQLDSWGAPEDVRNYLLKKNLIPVLEEINSLFGIHQKFLSCLFGHFIKNLEGKTGKNFPYFRLSEVFSHMQSHSINFEKICDVSKILIENPNMEIESLFALSGFVKTEKNEILSLVPELRKNFSKIRKSKDENAENRWLMGKLKTVSLGNIPLRELNAEIS